MYSQTDRTDDFLNIGSLVIEFARSLACSIGELAVHSIGEFTLHRKVRAEERATQRICDGIVCIGGDMHPPRCHRLHLLVDFLV
ncbi:hypothetical protein [Nocardia sp. NPDC024068]|uniref:hypothetical protein n=1 Tax=Nocardia sp. NPDC024068 TaxID=3157197 RepID=UPI003401A320